MRTHIAVLVFAMAIGNGRNAAANEETSESPRIKLMDRSVMIYPVGVDESGDSENFNFDIRMAEVIGVLLERAGMLPDVASESVPVTPADSLPTVQAAIREFESDREMDAELTLFVTFTGKVLETGRIVTKACTVVTEAAGKTVWSREDTEFPDGPPDCPMAACVHVVDALCSVSDLEDFRHRESPPEGKMHKRMAERSGVPPKEEVKAMEKRWEDARSEIKRESVAVFPFHVWGREEGSLEGAEELAKRMNQAGWDEVSAMETDPHLEIQGDRNELRVLWNTARAFRDYLKEHPVETDYALLVDATKPPNIGHLHLILCEGDGDWVLVDLQNSHHESFQRIDPDSLQDCAELALMRLLDRVSGPETKE